MTYQEYADKLNRHSLINKAKQQSREDFERYCSSEIEMVDKLRLPLKIEGRAQLLSSKESYRKCLQILNYVVGTSDVKAISKEEIVKRNIAKIIVQHYEEQGELPKGTLAKFDS